MGSLSLFFYTEGGIKGAKMGDKRILVVDDNPSDRLIVKRLADKLKCLTHQASGVFEAMDELEEMDFNLLIVDLQMPKHSGLQLVQRVRRMERFRTTPILIMSGRNRPHDVQSAIQTGANDYIIKPVDLQVLEEKITRLTQKSTGTWKSYPVPSELSAATVGLSANILMINEVAAEVWTTQKFEVENTFTLTLDLLINRGLAPCVVKIEAVRPEKTGYVYSLRFIGLTEADRKKIRLLCRDLWTQNSQLNATDGGQS